MQKTKKSVNLCGTADSVAVAMGLKRSITSLVITVEGGLGGRRADVLLVPGGQDLAPLLKSISGLSSARICVGQEAAQAIADAMNRSYAGGGCLLLPSTPEGAKAKPTKEDDGVCLTKREVEALRCRFNRPDDDFDRLGTYETVAKTLGVSTRGAYNIVKRAIEKIWSTEDKVA